MEDGKALTGLACPTRSQRTATDDDGTAISFDALTCQRVLRVKVDAKVGFDAPSGTSDHELDGIACHGTQSCVAVDTLGDIVRFDPRSRHDARVRKIDARLLGIGERLLIRKIRTDGRHAPLLPLSIDRPVPHGRIA
ncbi:MAG: hypothetical protein ACRDMX_02525 [Solirubrobacteraceae bacterium]